MRTFVAFTVPLSALNVTVWPAAGLTSLPNCIHVSPSVVYSALAEAGALSPYVMVTLLSSHSEPKSIVAVGLAE